MRWWDVATNTTAWVTVLLAAGLTGYGLGELLWSVACEIGRVH